MEDDRDTRRPHPPPTQEPDGIVYRLAGDACQVQPVQVAAVGEGEARLPLRVLLRDGVDHSVSHGTFEPDIESPRVGQLHVARAVAVDHVADPAHTWVERG